MRRAILCVMTGLGLMGIMLPAAAEAYEREVWRNRSGSSFHSRRAPGHHRAMRWRAPPSLYHRNPTYYPSSRAGSR